MDEYDYEDENGTGSTGPNIQITEPVDNDVDEDTVRIMVSTDNHLGFEEKDPIRGNDSFAAFEEVLSIAKRTKVRIFIWKRMFCVLGCSWLATFGYVALDTIFDKSFFFQA